MMRDFLVSFYLVNFYLNFNLVNILITSLECRVLVQEDKSDYYSQLNQGKRNEFLATFYNSKWKSKPYHQQQVSSKQDSGQVVPILTPSLDLLPSLTPAAASDLSESYLPNLGFLADLGGLVTRDFPASPFVKLGRDLFESEQCAQYVSCETSKFSRRYDYLNWIHEFLQDFPFQGDLADKLKDGSIDSTRTEKCGHSCNPLGTLRRGLKTLSLLHEVVRAAN